MSHPRQHLPGMQPTTSPSYSQSTSRTEYLRAFSEVPYALLSQIVCQPCYWLPECALHSVDHTANRQSCHCSAAGKIASDAQSSSITTPIVGRGVKERGEEGPGGGEGHGTPMQSDADSGLPAGAGTSSCQQHSCYFLASCLVFLAFSAAALAFRCSSSAMSCCIKALAASSLCAPLCKGCTAHSAAC